MSAAMRLFIALEIPTTLGGEIERRLTPWKPRMPKARWVRPEGRHVTLSFLGDSDPSAVLRLEEELTPVFSARRRLSLELTTVGAFPARGGCRVLWLGIRATGELVELQGAVARAVATATDRPPDRRPFHPHLTLARCRPEWPRAAAAELAEGFAAPSEPFIVAEGTLFESRLEPSGARYSAVGRYPFGGEG